MKTRLTTRGLFPLLLLLLPLLLHTLLGRYETQHCPLPEANIITSERKHPKNKNKDKRDGQAARFVFLWLNKALGL